MTLLRRFRRSCLFLADAGRDRSPLAGEDNGPRSDLFRLQGARASDQQESESRKRARSVTLSIASPAVLPRRARSRGRELGHRAREQAP